MPRSEIGLRARDAGTPSSERGRPLRCARWVALFVSYVSIICILIDLCKKDQRATERGAGGRNVDANNDVNACFKPKYLPFLLGSLPLRPRRLWISYSLQMLSGRLKERARYLPLLFPFTFVGSPSARSTKLKIDLPALASLGSFIPLAPPRKWFPVTARAYTSKVCRTISLFEPSLHDPRKCWEAQTDR